ncbi:uncharacterized protein METZ01_LOCUS245507, partial [marine metagenome]
MINNVLLIGSGKRMKNNIIPALYLLKNNFNIEGIYSRSIKNITLFENRIILQTTNNLDQFNFKKINLIIIAVTQGNLPDVIRTLSEKDTLHIKLLVDTPINIIDYTIIKKISKFSEIGVSEDSISLPIVKVAKEIINSNIIGMVRKIYLFHSGYRYHAMSLIRYLISSKNVRLIRKTSLNDTYNEIKMTFRNGVTANIVNPRDYDIGRMLIVGSSGSINTYFIKDKSSIYLDR